MTPNQAIDQLVDVVQPIVEHIESNSTPMTQGYYGDYMVAIMKVADRVGQSDGVYLAIGLAMIKAGANRQGVTAALRVLGKLEG